MPEGGQEFELSNASITRSCQVCADWPINERLARSRRNNPAYKDMEERQDAYWYY